MAQDEQPPPPPRRRLDTLVRTEVEHEREVISRISLMPPAEKDFSQLQNAVGSWLAVLDESNYYELLGVLEVSNQEGITHAFHEFSLAFHPDRHRGAPAHLVAGVTAIFKRGVEAYGVLRKPTTRNRYDMALARGQLRLTPESESAVVESEGPQSIRTASGLPSLTHLCSTPAGKLHARQAERALSEEQLPKALELLQKSIMAEGDNPQLKAAAEKVRALMATTPRLIDL